jgi:predicted heme/steroid binding protein/uncharacterized membrane protein
MKEYSPEELAKNNGKDGNPTLISHKARVFDISESKLWKGGAHMNRHQGGNDLTADIQAAPHGEEVLERYPQVGILKKSETTPEINVPKTLDTLLKKVPMLRRHPHPMTVHFPIVFMFSTAIFNILYIVTGIKAFEVTALHCLGGGILFTPVAIITGLYTWWLNYLAVPNKSVRIKRPLSIILFIIEIIVFVWRIQVPGILDTWTPQSIVYFLLILSFIPIVTVIGWYGAGMTFPTEGE